MWKNSLVSNVFKKIQLLTEFLPIKIKRHEPKLRNDIKKNEYNKTFPQSDKKSLPYKIWPILRIVILLLKTLKVLIDFINKRR